MGDKKSPTRPKRQAKQAVDDGYWDCSVCTFRNTAEAFKCSICDVRKGTSTRKPRINSQLVAQQVAQQFPMPPPAKKERRERGERFDKDRPEGEGGERRHELERPERVRDTDSTDKDGSDKEQPLTEKPLMEKPHTEKPHTEKPHTEKPHSEKPHTEKPHTEKPHIEKPHTEKPHIEKLHTEKPHTEKPDIEKEITPAITKKPGSKKRPKTDNHQSPPSDKHSIQSGKSVTKTNKKSHICRPKLKNIDRSTAQQLAITVGNVTVIITDFKEKTRSSSTSSSTITSSAASEQQHQSSGSESMDKSSSRASTPKGDLSVGHDESF